MPDYTEDEVADMMYRLPTAFETAQSDWGKFKIGVARGLFDGDQRRRIVRYYGDFSRLWEIVRPNFLQYPDGRPKPSHALAFAKRVDAWLSKFDQERKGFGLDAVPLLIIGAIVVSGLFGAAGVTWAIGYVQEQRNISQLISGVVDGKVPPEALTKAIEAEQSSPFGDLTGLFKWGLIAFLGFQLLPVIKDVVKRK